ncbi:phosphatidate cytidylyltransferase [Poseidonocella sedimentorum]|uniref:Phosphatidate cytidylyltransferase n=1 Tax=Poseidonocella sedimentorum TaxID=871652 RepID=A0A1I6DEE7_9RHOB|nr:phosphatidate cytidylyltransferase [Poseidonocella sedimentorum]SFR03829.1 phosphatidate cytidylyltransferase [Poseidonocella sedimentorum]
MASANWDDLRTRILTSAALLAVGALCVWLGGPAFHLLVVAICAAMAWELIRMTVPERRRGARRMALAVGAAVGVLPLLPSWGFFLPISALVAAGAGLWAERLRWAVAGVTVLIIAAGFGLLTLRLNGGIGWVLWLVSVVVATDVLGYFAGRALGGPKFWPRVSPKKTWSGTVAGWIGAALVGLGFMQVTGLGPELIPLSIGTSMASQAGDLLESACKRRCGVKDSSTLLPGHGGVWDRFDGMIGAAFFVAIIQAAINAAGVVL